MPADRLTRAEGIAVAQLSGIAMRHGSGRGEGDPIAELHEVSRDPRLLGHAAAAYTVDPNPHQRNAAELLRQAGADEQVIAEEAKLVAQRLREARPVMGRHRPLAEGEEECG